MAISQYQVSLQPISGEIHVPLYPHVAEKRIIFYVNLECREKMYLPRARKMYKLPYLLFIKKKNPLCIS